MPKIKYLVLSDLHLGEEGSLFTSKDKADYSMIDALGKALTSLLDNFKQEELPKLILNGDILGLSFSGYKDSLPIFEKFLKTFTKENRICENIVYLPGNHDHHIWNLAKEQKYREQLLEMKVTDKLPIMSHVTGPIYDDGIESEFLRSFLDSRGLDDFNIKIFYPNYLSQPVNDKEPFVLFHHGHFSEDTYHFVTKAMQAFFPELSTPSTVEELEASNGNWINFAFSELGRSGRAGSKFKELMAILSEKRILKSEIDRLSDNVANTVDFPYLPFDFLESELTKTLLTNISEHVRSERYKGNTTCSDETMEGLMSYLNKYCFDQMKRYNTKNQPCTLVWSHTHKPFQEYKSTLKFGDLKVLNTGGWVLPPNATPVIGASIVMVSDSNECQSFRIFNDSSKGGTFHFKIITAHNESPTSFTKIINNSVRSGENLKKEWKVLRDRIMKEIKTRRQDEQS